MANSILTYPGSAGFGPYAATFTLGKLRDAYVQVRVNEEVDGLDAPLYRDIEWISETLFNITSGTEPTGADEVQVLRTIPDDALIHDYSNGAVIEELNLDESNLQCIMLVHQFLDGRLTATLANDLDMGGHKIINLGEATEDTDAATWGQLVTLEAEAQASADSADADATQTAADRVQTGLDRTATGLDRTAVAADKVTVIADMNTVAADKAIVITDMNTVATDKGIVAADKATTLGYKNAADADVLLTHADVVLTHLDVLSTHADVLLTAADRVQTALDRIQTGLDKTATAADRVQTGNDVISTTANVAAALGYANAAAASAAGISMRKSCDLATTGALTGTYSNGASGVGATFTLTSTGVLTIDGVASALADVILLKDQASAFQNGIYTVTTAGAIGVAAVLTRSTDYDTAAEMKEGTATIITQGSVNASHIYVMTTNGGVVTVGTTNVAWTSLSANATSANTLSTPRLIGGVAFDGSGDITPTQIQPASEGSDTTCFLLFANAASGTAQQPKYNSGLGYNANTNAITATTFIGALTGTATSATALATGRTLSITGDLTWTSPSFDGSGNVTAAGTIANNAVSYAKMQDVTAPSRLLGRGSAAGSGDPQEITLSGLSMVGTVLTAAPQLGDATETSSGSSLTLTSSSNRVQIYSPSAAGLFVKLPDATTMSMGAPPFVIKNAGTFACPVIDAGTPGQAIAYLQPGEGCMIYLGNNATAKGKWYCGSGDMGNMTEILNGVTSQSVSGEVGNNNQAIAVAPITATTFLLVWQNNTAVISIRCAVITITNADTLSAGAVVSLVSLASLSGFCACALDASNVAVGYHGTSNTSIIVVGISGTTATAGTPTSIVATTSGNMHLFKISSSSVFCAYVTSTTSKCVVISGMSTAGNTINSVTTCRTSSTTEGVLSVSQADVNTYIIMTVGTSSFGDAQLITVSGTTVTANTALANFSSSTIVTGVQTIALSTTLFLTCYFTSTGVNMHYVVHRISTGTTLEVWAGGNQASGAAGNGFLRPIISQWYSLGTVILNSYAVFLWSCSDGGSYNLLYMDFFKFNATTRSVSYSHTVRGDAVNSYNYGRSGSLRVSAGKIACPFSPITGSAEQKVFILHGIENP